MKQAEKFNRPIITFVNTSGAYPGMEAEENVDRVRQSQETFMR